ncbi:MAG: hypothetical protein ACMUHU_01170 [Thermoplasmatota archaeon]
MKGILRTDRSGVTNVVSMIMILAIIVSFMGMVFATYLPAFGKDLEFQTLNEVMDSFMDLKSGLDRLSVGGDSGTSLTTKVTLGSDGGPVFGFGRMTGSLNLYEESGLITVDDSAGFTYGQGRGTVMYRSNNLYVEDQIITMEGGAIIRDQAGSSVLKGPPNMVLDNDVFTGSMSLYFLLINLEGESVSFSGTGSYLISTTLLTEEISSYAVSAGTDIIVTIETSHGDVWENTVDDIMEGEGLVKDVYDEVGGTWTNNDYRVEIAGDTVSLTVRGLTELVVRSSFFRVTMT